MKKTLVLASLLAAFGAASAQTSVTIGGVMDLGFIKSEGATASIGRGDNNRIIFSGSENLGGGLSAVFAAQMRFDADTGTVGENTMTSTGARVAFQGETRVGLAGGFGKVLLGRGLTAVQAPNGAYDPFGVATVGAMQGLLTAGYSSDPTQNGGGGAGRWSNGVFYTSNSMGGLTLGVSFTTKEAAGVVPCTQALVTAATNPACHSTTAATSTLGGTVASVAPTYMPYSLAANYSAGAVGAFLGFERNTVGTKYTQLAGSFNAGAFTLMASLASQKSVAGVSVNGMGVGLNAPVGAGVIKAGFAQTSSAGAATNGRKFAVGYQHNLSARTYIYTDLASERALGATSKATAYDVGIRHAF